MLCGKKLTKSRFYWLNKTKKKLIATFYFFQCLCHLVVATSNHRNVVNFFNVITDTDTFNLGNKTSFPDSLVDKHKQCIATFWCIIH